MADLVVDYAALAASRDDLAVIHRAFVAATAFASGDAGIWGHHAIEHAMDRFVNDWAKHRERLVDKLQKVHDVTQDCIDTFQAGDRKLAEALSVTSQ